MEKNKEIVIPVYPVKAVCDTVWAMPPCVTKKWDKAKTCPVNDGECSHAEIIEGTTSYYAKCKAPKDVLDGILLFKKTIENAR